MSLKGYISELNKQVVSNDIIVDLHFNAGISNATGTETFVPFRFTTEEHVLATKVSSLVSNTLNIKNRGIKDERQSQHNSLAIMRPNCTNILIEVCFITNVSDMQSYITNKKKLAKKLAELFSVYL